VQIEFEINTVTLRPEEIQKYFPFLLSDMQSYFPVQQSGNKRKHRKNSKTVSTMIDSIIDSLNDE
jgi:hypothetical protein